MSVAKGSGNARKIGVEQSSKRLVISTLWRSNAFAFLVDKLEYETSILSACEGRTNEDPVVCAPFETARIASAFWGGAGGRLQSSFGHEVTFFFAKTGMSKNYHLHVTEVFVKIFYVFGRLKEHLKNLAL